MERRSIPFIDYDDRSEGKRYSQLLPSPTETVPNGGWGSHEVTDNSNPAGPILQSQTVGEVYRTADISPYRSRTGTANSTSHTRDVRSPVAHESVDIEMQSLGKKRRVSSGRDVVDYEGTSGIPEVRTALFQTKKTVAQGFLDFALLTANASQLKNLTETENHPQYILCLTLLAISIIMQIIVAILLLIVGRMEYYQTSSEEKKPSRRVILYNDISTAGIFLITVANIFIAPFISHGKSYIPPVSAEAAYNEKMFRQQQRMWENISSREGNITANLAYQVDI